MSNDARKALVLFKVLRCGEPEEDTEVFNFTCKIAPVGVSVELGHGNSPQLSPVSKHGKRKATDRLENDDDSDIVSLMKEVVEVQRDSMSSGTVIREDQKCAKRSWIGEQRHKETAALMKLLSQRREVRKSGL